jgi:peptide/nickel transport system substrate-binding protein
MVVPSGDCRDAGRISKGNGMTRRTPIHPQVERMQDALAGGRCDRREFLRTVTLLGVGSAAAYVMAGRILGEHLVDPALAQGGTPARGGTLRCSMPVQEMTDPALFDWTEKSNVARHIVEYLTITGPDNITRPMLAESWEASDDLKTWTLRLRQGVKWHNGDDFDVEDVIFNFERWLDPATGSSNQGLFLGLTEETEIDGKPGRRMREGAIERVDDHTVRLHFGSAILSVPENLYNYPAAIVHRSFAETGADLSQNPLGTGPYTLAEFEVGSRAVLRRVPDFAYWGGEVYLDEIHYYDHGPASAAQLAAFASGQVDMIYEFDIASLGMAESISNSVIYEVQTSITSCVRMRVDQEPFTDRRVRQAILACVDAALYPELVYRGRALVGEHHHVAPIHPEYFELPKLTPDLERARELLKDAGHADGLDLAVDCGNTNGPWQQQVCEILKEQLAPADIRLTINLMPPNQYWEIWNSTPFGITGWTHRPLGTMTLSLGYRSGVPWNETGYANPEFDAALDEAEAILDPSERRVAMEKVERILQEDAVMVQPLWQPKFFIAAAKVRNLTAHPAQNHQFNQVWIEQA